MYTVKDSGFVIYHKSVPGKYRIVEVITKTRKIKGIIDNFATHIDLLSLISFKWETKDFDMLGKFHIDSIEIQNIRTIKSCVVAMLLCELCALLPEHFEDILVWKSLNQSLDHLSKEEDVVAWINFEGYLSDTDWDENDVANPKDFYDKSIKKIIEQYSLDRQIRSREMLYGLLYA